MHCQFGMKCRKGRLAQHVIGGDAVNADIEAAEIVARVDQRLIGQHLDPRRIADDADLADAADAGTGGFDIDDDEIDGRNGWHGHRVAIA
ncbi:hypothetical protein LTR94_033228 [Friedmanniomyces endolithicus]|nr:hypothetical protein LTR94_033228 [Friedmanniomyces endolithicus]